MIYIVHDTKGTTTHSGRRPQETSGRGQAHGRRTTLSGVYRQKEGLADFLLYSAGHRNGDREVFEVNLLESELTEYWNTPPTLTSLPGLEEEMAKPILPVSRLQFTHLSRLPGEKGWR